MRWVTWLMDPPGVTSEKSGRKISMTVEAAAIIGAVVIAVVIAFLVLQFNGIRIWPPKD